MTLMTERMTNAEIRQYTHLAERDALQAYVSALQQRFGPKLVAIYLFGSKAHDTAHGDSDIDIAVILEAPTTEDLSFARGFAFDIWLSHQAFLSIRAMSRESWERLAAMRSLFYRNLMGDGISLLPVSAA